MVIITKIYAPSNYHNDSILIVYKKNIETEIDDMSRI